MVRQRHKYMSKITDYLVLPLLLNKMWPTLVLPASMLCALFRVVSVWPSAPYVLYKGASL